jgi:tetratricopeptide (TPR) repeat protein
LAQDRAQRNVVADAYTRIGEIHKWLNEHQPAAEALKKSIQAREPLIAEDPDHRQHLLAIFRQYGLLSEALQSLADFKNADRALADARKHIQELTDRYPEPNGYKRLWGAYYLDRANLLTSMDALQEAEQMAVKAREICQELYPSPLPPSDERRRDLEACVLRIKSEGCLAEILQLQGRPNDARPVCETTLRLCRSRRRNDFHDSRSLSKLEEGLEMQLAKIDLAEGRLEEAAEHFRGTLESQRRNFKAGMDPILFSVNTIMGKASMDENFEPDPFCSYVETQLRLAAVLRELGRPYQTEQLLGECTRTSMVLCDTRPDILRYRVARANGWARTGQLLAQRRPEESRQAWQYADAIWQDTLAQFPHAAQYRSGVHGRRTDREWFQEHRPQLKPSRTERSLEYAQFKHPLRQTAFEQHAYGLSWYRAGAWKSAIDSFTKAAALRSSDHAFDWFYIAMAHQQLGEPEEARRWYDKAVEAIHKNDTTDEELLRLSRQADELLNHVSPN